MRVKICGITRMEDAQLAVELGASALGFIFYSGSPRFIAPADAAIIMSQLPRSIQKIAVFVSPSLQEVREQLERSGADIAQIHGEHSPELNQLGGRRLIYALPVHPTFDPSTIAHYRFAEAVLLDTYSREQHGGTGETFNWEVAVEAKKHGRIILAGGLNPNNIRSAIEQVNPWMLDVNSGVESEPGIKDHLKLKQLFDNIKEYLHETE